MIRLLSRLIERLLTHINQLLPAPKPRISLPQAPTRPLNANEIEILQVAEAVQQEINRPRPTTPPLVPTSEPIRWVDNWGRLPSTDGPSDALGPSLDLELAEILEFSEQLDHADASERLELLEFSEFPVVMDSVDGPTSEAMPPIETSLTLSDEPRPSSPDPMTLALPRGQLVEALLDEGWGNGLRTYAQLMKYIELRTGMACSKRVVSNWKRDRGFMDSTAA